MQKSECGQHHDEVSFTLRKLKAKKATLEGHEIAIIIESGDKNAQAANNRFIKNGAAHYYGESFVFSSLSKFIKIVVLDQNSRKKDLIG